MLDPGLESYVATLSLCLAHGNQRNTRTTCNNNESNIAVLTDLLKTGATSVIIKPSPWTKTFDKKKKTLIKLYSSSQMQ